MLHTDYAYYKAFLVVLHFKKFSMYACKHTIILQGKKMVLLLSVQKFS